jgi:hypothetical protein
MKKILSFVCHIIANLMGIVLGTCCFYFVLHTINFARDVDLWMDFLIMINAITIQIFFFKSIAWTIMKAKRIRVTISTMSSAITSFSYCVVYLFSLSIISKNLFLSEHSTIIVDFLLLPVSIFAIVFTIHYIMCHRIFINTI